ncbi:NAD-dependent epimerase/dehydratase family protein [Thauera sp. WH-2]|jgi:nucleoside-diphosphate-sugar epimerase|uniref:NAD-dependent epimerase/dehydratase family protein n=1 Tax=Thauera sp. WH-2 TaxID=3401574 RepID=UPI003AAA22E6
MLITGAHGFVGRALLARALADGRSVRAFVRRGYVPGVQTVEGDLVDAGSVLRACSGVDTIVHCAGLAHVGGDEALHWQVNHQGVRMLAEAAVQKGVRRLVLVSSVKAMAEPGEVCADEDWRAGVEPETAYGRSKRAAERLLTGVFSPMGLEVVIVRPCAVYGPGCKGGLAAFVESVARGRVPPLPETGAKRSLLHLDDLVEGLILAADEPCAAGRTYVLAGPDCVSSRGLQAAILATAGKTMPAWSVPAWALRAAARTGDCLRGLGWKGVPFDSDVLSRLFGGGCYRPARAEAELGWRARVRLEDGLRSMLSGVAEREGC